MKKLVAMSLALMLLVLAGIAVAEDNVTYAISCDTLEGWSCDAAGGAFVAFENGGKLDSENQKEGEACLTMDGIPEAFLGPSATFQYILEEPVDLKLDPETGMVKFWIYTTDPISFNVASKFQVGSDGRPDSNNYEWIFGNAGDPSLVTTFLDLMPGWNELTLKFADAAKVGEPNLAAINFVKFYALIMPADVTVKLDDIRFIAE